MLKPNIKYKIALSVEEREFLRQLVKLETALSAGYYPFINAKSYVGYRNTGSDLPCRYIQRSVKEDFAPVLVQYTQSGATVSPRSFQKSFS